MASPFVNKKRKDAAAGGSWVGIILSDELSTRCEGFQ